MDSLEFSKIAGAVLCALLAILLPKTLMEMGGESKHGGHGEEVGYTLPAPAAKATQTAMGLTGAAAGSAAAAPAGNVFDALKPILASAKADEGAATFKVCAACHSNQKGGGNKVGPALWGVVGRKTASVDGFAYSEGLKGKAGDWTYDRLAGFINNPAGWAPGTKMSYNGVKDNAKLADLLAYLGTLNDTPVPLPK